MSRVQVTPNSHRQGNEIRAKLESTARAGTNPRLKDIDTTGLTSAQIDAVVFGSSTVSQPADGLQILDSVNGLMRTRIGGKWGAVFIGQTPFWYGFWNTTTITTSPTSLNCVNNPYSQGGMVSSGGGVEVPVTGVYEVSLKGRLDSAGTVQYAVVDILKNGVVWGMYQSDNSFSAGIVWNWRSYQVTMRQVLNAGDVLTIQAATNTATLAATVDTGDGLYVSYCFPYLGSNP